MPPYVFLVIAEERDDGGWFLQCLNWPLLLYVIEWDVEPEHGYHRFVFLAREALRINGCKTAGLKSLTPWFEVAKTKRAVLVFEPADT